MSDEMSKAQMQYISVLLDNGCKLQFRTEHFGKAYVWLTDRSGHWFMESVPV